MISIFVFGVIRLRSESRSKWKSGSTSGAYTTVPPAYVIQNSSGG